MNQQTAPASRSFEVRYGPPEWSSFNEPWPNNLKLTGSGRVEIMADAIRFSDARNVESEALRTIRFAEIANAGHSEAEDVVAVRTLKGDREVLVWTASKDEARALFDILPRTTTPEFLARQEQHRKFNENLEKLAPRAPVTPTLIGINVAVFLLLAAAGAGVLATSGAVELRFGSNYGPATWGGQPWRLLTAAFIHFGVVHLAFNMYALFNGGVLTERLYGSARFAVIYLLSALAGNVVSGWWDASRNSAGASGAVFGVFAALLVFAWRRPADIPRDILKSVRSGAALMLVYSLAMGMAMDFIDNAAHVGGLLGGALAGLLLVRPFEPEARAAAQPWRIAAVTLAIGAALTALAAPLFIAYKGLR